MTAGFGMRRLLRLANAPHAIVHHARFSASQASGLERGDKREERQRCRQHEPCTYLQCSDQLRLSFPPQRALSVPAGPTRGRPPRRPKPIPQPAGRPIRWPGRRLGGRDIVVLPSLARISHQANRTRSTTGPANDNEGFSVRRGAAGAPSDTLRPAAESDRRRWDTPRPSGASAVHAGGLRRTVAPQQRSGYARWRFASACAKSRWRGKTLLSAMTTRRTLTVTSAPSFSSRVRIVLT